MRIRKISLFPLKIPLIEPFIISLGPLTHAENVVIRMETVDGLIGWGECSPFRTIHGETIKTCLTIGEEIARQVIGGELETPEALLSLMDRSIFGNSSIKSAFDIAFHDLLAQQQQLPIYRMLGGTSVRSLFTDYTISLSSKEKMMDDARTILEKGFPVIKVKLGGEPTEDIERIRAIRTVIGKTITLRIDANQGWTKQGALIALKGIADFGVEHCEEPLPRWQYRDLPEVREHSTIPIMADESCCTEFDAEKLSALNACSGINIKLGKSSGFVRAQRIASIAKSSGFTMQVGGFLESRLGFTAAAHFAMAHPEINCIDFDTPLMFTEDPIEGGIRYGEKGRIDLSQRAGLGASLKKEFEASEGVIVA